MKKKLLSLLLALAMVFTLAACGEKKPDPGKDATATEPVVILQHQRCARRCFQLRQGSGAGQPV